jgi:Cys-rich repeat protein
MRKLTGGLIALAFLLCAFTAQAASGIEVSVPSAGEACSDASDCAAGEECVADVCVIPPECTVDGDCAVGEECVAGECVEIPPECTVDGDCAAGEECINDICVPSVGDSCSDTSDCAVGESPAPYQPSSSADKGG